MVSYPLIQLLIMRHNYQIGSQQLTREEDCMTIVMHT